MLSKVATVAREAAVAGLVLLIAWARGVAARCFHKLGALEKRVGATRAQEALALARLEACRVCPLKRGDFCGDCGCYMPAKARIEQSKCPRGKW